MNNCLCVDTDKNILFGNISTECMTSPAQSKNEPHKVEIHSVKFREKDIDVVWENVTSSKTGNGTVLSCFIK